MLYNDNTIENNTKTLENKVHDRMMDDSIYLHELTMHDPLFETGGLLNSNITINDE